MSISNLKPESRKQDIVVQELEDEVLVYDLIKNKAFCLNETSAIIWQACNGERTIEEIADISGKILNTTVTAEIVWLALEQFKKDNLLEENAQATQIFSGLTRREVIRKIGFSSAVALPIITSLVAPPASYAQSPSCPSATCRCPNSSTSCNGSTATVGGVSYINCRTNSGGNPSCNCVGPFGPPNSAGSGFKASLTGCMG